MAKNTQSINLFKKEEKSNVERILEWALTIGRILVIVTEGIALSAFLYRFTLDMQLVDLHDKLKEDVAQLHFREKEEQTFRDIQNRLALSKQYGSNASEVNKVITDLITFGQGNAIYNNLAINNDSVKIDADVKSVSALTTLINNFRRYPLVKSVSLDKIENKTTEAVININVTLQLVKPVTTAPADDQGGKS